MVDVETVVEPGNLAPYLRPWDELTVAEGRPYAAPAWLLAWWRTSAPKGSLLRVFVALEGGALLGVAPFFVDREPARPARYQPLGAGTFPRAEPLARSDRREEVLTAFVRALASASPLPSIVSSAGVGAGAPWSAALAWWPGGRSWRHVDRATAAPVAHLGDSFGSWLASKSRNFRSEFSRKRRRLEGEGGSIGMASLEDLDRHLGAFGHLHQMRWDPRGGSGVLRPGVEAMLREAGRELVPAGRFRLWSIEVDGRIVSSHLFLAAGRELAYWLGGFDDAWSAFSPANLVILAAIEHAFGAGNDRVDLGAGAQDYKYRFADGEETLEWATVIPPGDRHWRTRLRLAPRYLRTAAARRVPGPARERIRRLVPRRAR